jgi:hypothetical protein
MTIFVPATLSPVGSMKRILNIFIFIFSLSTMPVLSNTEDEITWIRNEYKITRSDLNNYTRQKYSFSGESTEGSGGVGYITKKGEIKLIEVTYYFETGKVYYEFYYSNNNTFFIFEKKFAYNTHFLMTEELVEDWYKEDGIRHEAFDPNKTKVDEWRYYFHDNNVVRIIDSDGAIISESDNAMSVLDSSINNHKRLNKQILSTPKSGATD